MRAPLLLTASLLMLAAAPRRTAPLPSALDPSATPRVGSPPPFALVSAAPLPSHRSACQPAVSTEPPAFDLAAARRAIRARDVSADVRFLCVADLGGRPTPSRELDLAANYLAARLRAQHLEPGSRAGFRLPYPLVHRRLDPQASYLDVEADRGRARLRFPQDWVLARRSQLQDGEARGPLAAVPPAPAGSDPEFSAPGSFALILDPGRSYLRSLRAAAAGGSVAALVALDPHSAGRPYAERYADLSASLLRGWVESPAAHRSPRASELPLMLLTDRGLERLLKVSGGSAERPGAVELHRVLRAETRVQASNVVGLWRGREREGECLVVCAHFDHLGRSGGQLFPGADDNASGTAALLAVASGLRAGGRLERSVLLLGLSGEEEGFWGAAAWAADPRLPGDLAPVAAVNLDMVGRTAPDELYLTPSADHEAYNAVAAALEAAALREGFAPLRSQDEFWTRSDHYQLHQDLGIPVAYLSSGDHDDYHRPTDTPDKLDPDKVARVARTVLRALVALDGVDLAPRAR